MTWIKIKRSSHFSFSIVVGRLFLCVNLLEHLNYQLVGRDVGLASSFPLSLSISSKEIALWPVVAWWGAKLWHCFIACRMLISCLWHSHHFRLLHFVLLWVITFTVLPKTPFLSFRLGGGEPWWWQRKRTNMPRVKCYPYNFCGFFPSIFVTWIISSFSWIVSKPSREGRAVFWQGLC